MARYVDGFILAVPNKKRAAYLRMARLAKRVWLEYGALQYCEAMGDDTPFGKLTSFPRSVKLKKGETAWFSFIVYRSRKDRDRINAKVMQDKRFAKYMNPKSMPFDAKRMIFGGFKILIDG
jgi:uncharacterized protein YbaA (DUF1428 family)